MNAHTLAELYRRAHDLMRNSDGLQPQEALDELLKYLFFKQQHEIRTRPSNPVIALTEPRDDHYESSETAQWVRKTFSTYATNADTWADAAWPERGFRLSDATLLAMHGLFRRIMLTDLHIDVLNTAIREFIAAELRKGLGIFLTPDGVAKMMVDFVEPNEYDYVIDPACGSGTFLKEVLSRRKDNARLDAIASVWGIDKNPKMLMMTQLNVGAASSSYRGANLDSLFDIDGSDTRNELPRYDHFDAVFTNPPFGVNIDPRNQDLSRYRCSNSDGKGNRLPSEVLFIEQCLNFLKPGGRLAIILPKSVLTNRNLSNARKELGHLGYIYAAVNLPPETFGATGTQTTAYVLFIRKFDTKEDRLSPISIPLVEVDNVGFDTTGRPKDGSQLPQTAALLKAPDPTANGQLKRRVLTPINKNLTFSYFADSAATTGKQEWRHRLGDYLEIATTGKTPRRADYTSHGLFLVKVGNLTGSGIRWIPRDRNYTSGKAADRIRDNNKLMLRTGDILLTSSAHSPVYIAKKVDIVARIPDWVGREASFVGEVMMLRPWPEVDSYNLLAYLRQRQTIERVQHLIRGQTAHLHPKDLLMMTMPDPVTIQGDMSPLADILRNQAIHNEELNESIFAELQYTAPL